jgi:arylsulfatase A-like enzyme
MRSFLQPWLSCLLFGIGSTVAAGQLPPPNILLVMADDLGFSDLGCYGSEIETPTLDRLAAQGMRWTQFYNTAKCHSSRVSLLTGRWCRQAGDEGMQRAMTTAELLAPAGYFTAMAGKWHLARQPTDFGFQRFFGHLSGACNYYRGDQSFRLNGQPWPVPKQGFYTTTANIDFSLRFLEEARAQRQPWFLYVAFNAPHAPLQPLQEDYAKYQGRYDQGWDRIRQARVDKQRRLGLFAGDVAPSPRPSHVPAWEELPPSTRDWEARRMTAYAALIDRLDRELGRLIENLEAKGELQNTLILFMSDNGACPYDRRSSDRDRPPYDPEVTWSDSTGWAWARNTPFRYYKQNQFEGGISSPLVAHWPAGLQAKPGSVVHAPAHLVDIFPTLAEVGRATIPVAYPQRDLTPLAGVSLAPFFSGKTLTSRPPIHFLFASDRGLRDGDWKLVSFQSQPWELYNLAEDRTELHDLAARHPEIVARMSEQWHRMAAEELQAPAKERQPVARQATEQRHREWSVFDEVGQTNSRLEGGSRPGKKGEKAQGAPPLGEIAGSKMRARRDTQLSIEGDQLILSCTEGDPGLAIQPLSLKGRTGPYLLSLEIQSRASGMGEVYFTTDPQTSLPRGEHLEFEVAHDGQWHTLTLPLTTDQVLYGLRLDPCTGAGQVRLRQMQLKSAAGEVLSGWPEAR